MKTISRIMSMLIPLRTDKVSGRFLKVSMKAAGRQLLVTAGRNRPRPAGQVKGALFPKADIAKVGVIGKRNNLRLLLFLQVRRRRCVFLVVADDPLDGADFEYGALDAAHCQRNRTKRHDKSPKRTAVSRMVLPAHETGSHFTTRRASRFVPGGLSSSRDS